MFALDMAAISRDRAGRKDSPSR